MLKILQKIEKIGHEKNVEFVVLVKSFPTSIWLQKSASIQKRTSPSKFGSQITLSMTYRASCSVEISNDLGEQEGHVEQWDHSDAHYAPFRCRVSGTDRMGALLLFGCLPRHTRTNPS